jgi:hypothetical protein
MGGSCVCEVVADDTCSSIRYRRTALFVLTYHYTLHCTQCLGPAGRRGGPAGHRRRGQQRIHRAGEAGTPVDPEQRVPDDVVSDERDMV